MPSVPSLAPTMPRLLSLPPELLYKIIQMCSPQDRSHLRLTCKTLKDHADPVVFQRLRLFSHPPHVNEHQIITLATRSSRACELTKAAELVWIPDDMPTSERSRPYFGHCDDLRVHLTTAISALRNTTRFRWVTDDKDSDRLINSIMHAIARLPRLTELDIETPFDERRRIPLGIFSNLSRLSVACFHSGSVSFNISQIATAIANSPRLKSLRCSFLHSYSLPKLSELFAKLSADNPLHLEHLDIRLMDATLDGMILPHLTRLTSLKFHLTYADISVAQSVWTSFLVNNVKLTNVELSGLVTEETMLYLSSFSGLKRLAVNLVQASSFEILDNLRNTFFMEVLPKHVNSLQTLQILGSDENKWVIDRVIPKSITECLKLRDLCICINGEENSTFLQPLLDTVARLPELEALHCFMHNAPVMEAGLANFKPSQGLRYVEELECNFRPYVLEREGGQPVGYREIK